MVLKRFLLYSVLPGLVVVANAAPVLGQSEAEPALPAGLVGEPSLLPGLGNDEPGLPEGLGGGAEPALPGGLGGQAPDLPAGLTGDRFQSAFDAAGEPGLAESLGVTGFWEARLGYRTRTPVDERNTSMAETRIELEKDWFRDAWTAKVTADALYDDIEESHSVDLQTGAGWLDLREAWLRRQLGDSADFKGGRQILTWGVGDLLFINDLFPKDWNSFFIGRDDQYLKAPSDALRLGVYSDAVNVNLVYTPRFDSDRYIDGRRLSYYSPLAGEVVGRNMPVEAEKPDDFGDDDERALRTYRRLGGFDVALYAYHGLWKSPAGFDPVAGLATFPRLNVYGASLRGQAGPGIVSTEIGYYDSRDDTDGDDPLVNNSEWRGLLGYEWEVVTETTLGLQYYLEALQDYAAYEASLMTGQPARDEYRHLLTARLTRLAMNQNLTLGIFAYYSPSDRDYYLRPKAGYKASDHWLVEGGLNLFGGDENDTFFGQFESDSNVYLAVRYGF